MSALILGASLLWGGGASANPIINSRTHYEGTVEIRGNEPFTYAVLITADRDFEIAGPLVERLIANYQQRLVRVRGYVERRHGGAAAPSSSARKSELTLLVIEKIVGLVNS